MAYKTKELEKKAIKAIKENKLIFIEEVVSYLPCSKPTFYEHKLNELDSIEALLNKNKDEMKATLRNKWYLSDNATLQITLYRLLCTDAERRKIAMNYNEHTGKDGKDFKPIIFVPVNGNNKRSGNGSLRKESTEPGRNGS